MFLGGAALYEYETAVPMPAAVPGVNCFQSDASVQHPDCEAYQQQFDQHVGSESTAIVFGMLGLSMVGAAYKFSDLSQRHRQLQRFRTQMHDAEAVLQQWAEGRD